MFEGSNTSALLGLHGMAMTGIEVADEVTIMIETTADRVGCRSCGVIFPVSWLHTMARSRMRNRTLSM